MVNGFCFIYFGGVVEQKVGVLKLFNNLIYNNNRAYTINYRRRHCRPCLRGSKGMPKSVQKGSSRAGK